jgi:sugar phosphate isomerase/epimerase
MLCITLTSAISRRKWLSGAAAAAAAANLVRARAADPQRLPLKIGHRAASMKMVGDFEVFRVARRMPGILGVELQIAGGNPNLHDPDAVRRYKKEAGRWGLMIPSLAGVWDKGQSFRTPGARKNLQQAIRAAEMLGSRVILVAGFRAESPDMSKESSYGPVVALLSGVAREAADAAVVLGIETSMSPRDHGKFVDLVGSPAVKVYYDIHNMPYYGHAAEAIPGITLLGKDRICQVHVKNEDHLIEEPGTVDWAAAFRALNEIGYDGWYVFETQHHDPGQMLDSTARNVAFLQKHCRMPVAE